METKFTEQESLAIISEMIGRARNNVRKGAGAFMIFWGYMVASVALLNVALLLILHRMALPAPYSFHVWWLMAPAWVVSFVMKRKIDRSATVKTHIDAIISSVWTAFGISMAIFLLMIFGLSYSLQEYYHFFCLINPIIILIVGIGEFITAKACRFRPFMHGAMAMWTGSLASTLAIIVFRNAYEVVAQFLVLAVCMIVGFVIPGYKLNKLAEEHHV